MIIPDVNVLVYAHRADTPGHEAYRDWLRAALRAEEPVALPDVVLSGVVRVVTDSRVFKLASSLEQAFAFVSDLCSSPGAIRIRPGLNVLGICERLCRDGGVRGADVADAYLAAVALDAGATLYTADRGFARFPGLEWRHPLGDAA